MIACTSSLIRSQSIDSSGPAMKPSRLTAAP
jgi:hypothetical protein